MTTRHWFWIGIALVVAAFAIWMVVLVQPKSVPFRPVNSTTRIILNGATGRPGSFDLSGDQEIVDAINELKIGHHIVGRCDGDKSIRGIIQIDQEDFEIDACMVGSRYSAIVRTREGGWWENSQLGELLIKRNEFNSIANFRQIRR